MIFFPFSFAGSFFPFSYFKISRFRLLQMTKEWELVRPKKEESCVC
jgi:hypothetical protein